MAAQNTDKYHIENLLIKSLINDLGDFKKEALDFLSAEFIEGKDERQPAKYHVSINIPFKGTPSGKNIFFAANYFSPALNSLACLKSSMTVPNPKAAQYLFKAGIDYFHEWASRKKSVIAFMEYRRGNPNTELQLSIIEAKIMSPGVTGYALDRDDIAPKKTAENVIRQLKKFMSGIG